MAVLVRRCRAALPERLGAVGCHIGWEKVGQKYNGTTGPTWRIEDHEPPSKRLQTAYSLTATGVTPPAPKAVPGTGPASCRLPCVNRLKAGSRTHNSGRCPLWQPRNKSAGYHRPQCDTAPACPEPRPMPAILT